MDLHDENEGVGLRTLRTARLVLRPLQAEDAPVIAEALNDFAISKWLTMVPFPYTVADAEWFIAENAKGRFRARMIYAGDQFIGVMSLDEELGYWLARDAWGQGYATEAARAVLAEHFADPANAEARSSHFVENKGSQKVLTKLGFVDVGPHAHFSKARQAEVPGRSMLITRADWDRLRSAAQ